MLNPEGHDVSQYLPQGVPPVNPFRAQHKGVKWDGEAIRAVNWLPEMLYEKNQALSKEHLDTCRSFFRILVQAKRTLGICDLRGVLFEKPPSDKADCDAFLEIGRRLCKPEMNAIMWVVWDDYNRGNIALAQHMIGTIKHGLENAQKIIEDL